MSDDHATGDHATEARLVTTPSAMTGLEAGLVRVVLEGEPVEVLAHRRLGAPAAERPPCS